MLEIPDVDNKIQKLQLKIDLIIVLIIAVVGSSK